MSLIYAVYKTMIERGIQRQCRSALQFVPVLFIDNESSFTTKPQTVFVVFENGSDSCTFEWFSAFFGSNWCECF